MSTFATLYLIGGLLSLGMVTAVLDKAGKEDPLSKKILMSAAAFMSSWLCAGYVLVLLLWKNRPDPS